jgi:hypothetical protein
MRNKTGLNPEQQKQGHPNEDEGSHTDQPLPTEQHVDKRRQGKRELSMPYLDPRLKFHMAMNLMGEKTAREYLEWVFMEKETGKLPPGSEEQINRILERTLVHRKSEQKEQQSA